MSREQPSMSTLASPTVSKLLDRLFAAADQNDPAGFAHARDALARLEKAPSDRQRAELMRDVYMPVSPEVGRLLYLLARNRNANLIVEFGTSFGISGIHLASALRDAGRGRLVTTEFDAVKAERARENFRSAGLDDLIDIRVGDAFETLEAWLDGGIDLVLLDGWKPLYLPMLKFLEPRLSPGALIIADDLAIAPDALAAYVGYVRGASNGYVSVEVPLGDRIEISVRA
jgi:predicted O-methyltransferase YrrM